MKFSLCLRLNWVTSVGPGWLTSTDERPESNVDVFITRVHKHKQAHTHKHGEVIRILACTELIRTDDPCQTSLFIRANVCRCSRDVCNALLMNASPWPHSAWLKYLDFPTKLPDGDIPVQQKAALVNRNAKLIPVPKSRTWPETKSLRLHRLTYFLAEESRLQSDSSWLPLSNAYPVSWIDITLLQPDPEGIRRECFSYSLSSARPIYL